MVQARHFLQTIVVSTQNSQCHCNWKTTCKLLVDVYFSDGPAITLLMNSVQSNQFHSLSILNINVFLVIWFIQFWHYIG